MAIVVVGILTFNLLFLAQPVESPEIVQEENLEIEEVVEEKVVEKTAQGEKSKNETKEEEVLIIENEPVVITEIEIEPEETAIEIDQGLIDLIVTIPPIQTETPLSTSDINTKAREALVNIICTSIQGGLLQPITGSGIIIDNRGVILTNAHIAQYFLLEDYIVENYLNCTIRTGSPAINTYEAELLFISSTWVKNNYQKISLSNPKGTGENDFALLLITDVTMPRAILPLQFPFISPDLRELKPEVGESVVVVSYPAGFLSGISIQKDLYAVSTVTEVMGIFTFKENTLDLFSVGGNIAAQKGSSGGGIINFDGRLFGIVVTSSDAAQTEDRDLRAITLSHINRSMESETGINLNNYLFGNLSGKSKQFGETVAPELTILLENALNN